MAGKTKDKRHEPDQTDSSSEETERIKPKNCRHCRHEQGDGEQLRKQGQS